MSLYSRYSESSISVSYFSRSSALIWWKVLPLANRVQTSSRMRAARDHSPRPGQLRLGRVGLDGVGQADVAPAPAMLAAGPQAIQGRHVLGCVVALVRGESVAGQPPIEFDH